jgi:Xaa-Pro aminopeptidase
MKQEFFTTNRQIIAESLKNELIVIGAYAAMQRGNDASFKFEQDANFWYLTGIEAPNWWVIIDGKSNKSWLVAPEIDDIHSIYNGSLSHEDAKNISGVDEVITENEASDLLIDLSEKYETVYTLGKDPGEAYYDFVLNPAQKNIQKRLGKLFKNIKDCRLDIAKIRAIKQPEEIEAIEKAVSLTIDAFKGIKNKLPNLKYEYEVEAEFTYYFRKNEAEGHAYDPIVASGKNACTLHYVKNNDVLVPGTLLLVDIGAQCDSYASDITRTYAIGTPTQRQRDVHAAVESAHHQIIELLTPGLKVKEYHEKTDIIIKSALGSLGLLKDPSDYRKYFPHAISHGLGIDVHDSLGGPDVFLPGMVLTVEPGIYIPEEAIGVRIEDDILITETGHENLSGHLSTSL